MKTKQSLYHSIFHRVSALYLVLLLLVTGCGGQETPDVEKEDMLQLSDQEIELEVGGWKPLTESRATIFENKDDIQNNDPEKGGGYFTLHAYLRETGATFIGGAMAWYFVPDNATVGSWRFYDNVNKRFLEYFWPENYSVDFFAYMPWSGSTRHKSITVGNYESGGLNLTCQMQQPTTLEDTDGQETIFAYTTGKVKKDKSVNMNFVHPFASVSFELMQAHRNLEINWIQFDNVYLNGNTTLNSTITESNQIIWSTSGSKGTFKIPVDRIIPEQINFGAKIGGPYLVMPQTLEGITVTINYTWDDDGNHILEPEDTQNLTSLISVDDIEKWIPGCNYKYVLHLGDNKEEILFKVEVEPWQSTGKNNNIFDIE